MPDRPTIRRLGPADYAVMPWKNGLGVTTELAISPAGSSLAGPFTWRLSVATLSASGPFSRLAGIERHIVQLEGSPMRLTHADRPGRELTLLEPYLFQGDSDTHGDLSGPARDFNVMTARDCVQATVSVYQLRAESVVHGSVRGEVALYGFSGTTDIAFARATPQSLAAEETLLFTGVEEEAVGISLTAKTDAVVFLVSFARKA